MDHHAGPASSDGDPRHGLSLASSPAPSPSLSPIIIDSLSSAPLLETLPATVYRPPPVDQRRRPQRYTPPAALTLRQLQPRQNLSLDFRSPALPNTLLASLPNLFQHARSTSLDSPLPTPFSPGAYFRTSVDSVESFNPRDLDM